MKKACFVFLFAAWMTACSGTDTQVPRQTSPNPALGNSSHTQVPRQISPNPAQGGSSHTQVPRQTSPNPVQGNSSHLVPATGKGPCYEIGYKWGVCAAKNTADGSCDPEKDVVIPKECNDRPETKQGLKDGVRSVQMRLPQPYNQ